MTKPMKRREVERALYHRRSRRQRAEADGVPTGGVVAVNKSYVATAAREGQWWVITVDGVGVTQSRTLRDAPNTARGLISAMLDVDEEEIVVLVEPVLDRELAEQVRVARKQVADLNRLQRDTATASREAARALVAAGVSGADAATVLGVSPQRVSQLLAPAKPARAPEAGALKTRRRAASRSSSGSA